MAFIWTERTRFCRHCGELREYEGHEWLSSCRCGEWEEIRYEGRIEGSFYRYYGTIEIEALPDYPVVYIAENVTREARVDGYSRTPKYVGRTLNFKRRVKRHFSDAKKGRGHYFHEALRHWGPRAFVWSLFDEVRHPEYFKDGLAYVTERHKRIEAECIETYQTATWGYNLKTEESPIRKASDEALIRELTYRGYKFH